MVLTCDQVTPNDEQSNDEDTIKQEQKQKYKQNEDRGGQRYKRLIVIHMVNILIQPNL